MTRNKCAKKIYALVGLHFEYNFSFATNIAY